MDRLMDRLQEILQTMDVPNQRFDDIRWLSRNLFIKNREHPDFDEAWTLVNQRRSTLFSLGLEK